MLPDAHRRQDELDRFRTLLVTSFNAGCSLQALMALLGHVSAEMSLRYGRLFGGYCLRTAAQGSCAYANICEHCPNFRSEASFLPVLQLQRVDAEALAADAEQRGWGEEAARHRRLIERLDLLITQAHAS